jgi:hypothetical protein
LGVLQVQQQPDGTFSTREHSLLVLPLFLEPALAYLLYETCHHALEWRDAKDVFRLKNLDGKLRKMVTDLKVRGLGSMSAPLGLLDSNA